MDRLARNTVDLRGVTVEFIKEHLTFSGGKSDHIGTLMLTILGDIAQFERALIKERQAEGIAIAKANGVYKGRKRALTREQVADARDRIGTGVPKVVVACTRAMTTSAVSYRQRGSGKSWSRPLKHKCLAGQGRYVALRNRLSKSPGVSNEAERGEYRRAVEPGERR